MTSTETPAVARRHLRLTLRGIREQRELTQAEIADALEWSLSKVVRIEQGDVTISTGDLKALLAYYEIRDEELVQRLLDESRAARRRDKVAPRMLTTPTAQLLQFESQATAFRCYQPTLVPGIFQTAGYAAAVMNFWNRDLSEEVRSARLEVRSHRYGQVFGGPNPPQYLLILDESVVWRQIGGVVAMVEQLEHLLGLVRQGRILVRISPFEIPGAGALIGSFLVIDLGERDAVLYRESHQQDEIVQTAGEVERHRHIFEEMWHNALGEDATARLIAARAAFMQASLDRASSPGA